MVVPAPLLPYIDIIRTNVRNANALNFASSHRNVHSMLDKILSLIRQDKDVERCADDVRAASDTLVAIIKRTGLSPISPEVDDARNRVLSSMDRLGESLQNAKPTDSAQFLGLGW